MKSLQEQYNLIKEGKGHKDVFLKEAKSRFPNMLTNSANFEQVEKILVNRSVIQENYVDLKPITKIENMGGPKKDFELAFEKFLAEGESQLSPIINKTGKPNTREEAEKIPAESKAKFKIGENGMGQYTPDKTVENSLDNQYPYSPTENNINNVSGQELLNGVYYECKANPELGLREAQELVIKNLSKDPLHYVKEGQFGEAVGYQTENGGMKKNAGENYGGSGYSEKLEDSSNHYEVVNESKELKIKDLIKESLGGVVTSGNPTSLAAMSGEVIKQMMAEDEGTNVSYKDTDVALEARQKAIEASQEAAGMSEDEMPSFPDVNEAKKDHDGDGDIDSDDYLAARDKAIKKAMAKKPKKESIDTKLNEIGKQGDIVKLEAQLEFLNNHIDEKIERVSSINEDDNLAELVDKKKMKMMQKEIKILERRKMKMEKVYERMTGKKYKKVMDEDSNANSNYGSNNNSNYNSNENPSPGSSYSGLQKYKNINEIEIPDSFMKKVNSEVTNAQSASKAIMDFYRQMSENETLDFARNSKMRVALERLRELAKEEAPETANESFDSLVKKVDKAKGYSKKDAQRVAGFIANRKRAGAGSGPTKKMKKREKMKEDNPVNWNDKNNPTKGPSGERDPRQVGQSVSPYSTTR